MPTKLLLVEDVEDLGRSGDIVNVKPGFARNFLLPQGLGVIADKRSIRMQARLQAERKKKAETDRKESEEIAQKLEGQTLTTIVKVDEEGRMYGSVSAADIRKLIEENYNQELLKKAVQLRHPIKETGEHAIQVRLKEDVEFSITLKVEPEGGPKEPKKAAKKAPAEETEKTESE